MIKTDNEEQSIHRSVTDAWLLQNKQSILKWFQQLVLILFIN